MIGLGEASKIDLLFELAMQREDEYYELAALVADRFADKCDRCGNCCKNIPAMLMPGEPTLLAKLLRTSEAAFLRNFTVLRPLDTGMAFSVKVPYLKVPCPFLEPARDGKGKTSCTIHSVRPCVCRTYPLADEILHDCDHCGVSKAISDWIFANSHAIEARTRTDELAQRVLHLLNPNNSKPGANDPKKEAADAAQRWSDFRDSQISTRTGEKHRGLSVALEVLRAIDQLQREFG